MDNGPHFHIKSIYEKRALRDATRLKAYNAILKRVFNRISYTTKVNPDQNTCAFVVPEFIPGFPMVNVEDASTYIILRLNASGLDVTYTRPNVLYISWAVHDTVYNKEMNPFASVYNMTGVTAETASAESSMVGETKEITPTTTVEDLLPIKSKKVTTSVKRVDEYIPTKSFY